MTTSSKLLEGGYLPQFLADDGHLRSTAPAPDDIVVSFQSVRKSYDGESLVVNDLDLDVRRGEFLTMLGPSGSGKTTSLMMLAGFEAPTAGQILLEGRSLNEVPPYKRNIGVVFQNYALFPHMTVADNVAFPLRRRGLPRVEIEDRVRRMLDLVQLASFGQRRPQQLSGGQQQRVAVARALAFDPKLVLMDEPLGALDKQLRERMQLEIKRLHERLGVTIVYVTHDQSEALTMSDRIAVFDNGRVQQLADPIRLYEEPANAFVAGFIGESNRLEGKIVSIADNSCDVVLANGQVVAATAVTSMQVGSMAVLCIRPEWIEIARPDVQVQNVQLQARVRDLVYLGDHVRVHGEIAGLPELVVKIPNSHRHLTPAIDASISLSWQPMNCRAFTPE
jgi:putative spermidine/putrescine transport system ATP-binding protein